MLTPWIEQNGIVSRKDPNENPYYLILCAMFWGYRNPIFRCCKEHRGGNEGTLTMLADKTRLAGSGFTNNTGEIYIKR